MDYSGWFKIWRQLFEHPMYRHAPPRQRNVIVTVIAMCEWRREGGRAWIKGLGELEIARGSFVATVADIARESNDTRQVVRDALERMFRGAFLTDAKLNQSSTSRGTSKHRLYTVVNYCKWQDDDDEGTSNRRKTQPVENQSTTTTGPLSIYEEEQEERSAPKSRKKCQGASKQTTVPELEIPSWCWSLADLWRELHLRHDPAHPVGGRRWSKLRTARAIYDWHLAGAAEPIPAQEIERVLRYALDESEVWTGGGHWRDKCSTPAKLFKHWATLKRQAADGCKIAGRVPAADDPGWQVGPQLPLPGSSVRGD